jgi:hypothetical protein
MDHSVFTRSPGLLFSFAFLWLNVVLSPTPRDNWAHGDYTKLTNINYFVLVGLGFELKASHLQSHTSSPFFSGYFGDVGVSPSICPGWPHTIILPVSTLKVARITGVDYWCLTHH